MILELGKANVPRSAAPGENGAPAVPPGSVQIYCADPPTNIICLLGAEPVVLSGGYGGWEVVNRPRQVGMTLWQGVEPFQVQLPLMLNDWHRAGAETDRVLRRLSRIARGDDDSEPGVIQIGGVPLPAEEWVIEEIEFDEPLRAASDLALERQPLTLVLREFVPPEYLQLRRRALKGRRRRTKVITVKKGDTPARIARRHKCKWTALRELNPGIVKRANQTPRKGTKFHVGVKLRVPAPQPRKKPKGGKKGKGQRGRGND